MTEREYNHKEWKDWYNDLPDKKGFTLNNQKLMFTYKNHIDKKNMDAFIRDVAKNYDIKFLRIAHEKGEEDEYPHSHVLVDFGKPFQCKAKGAERKFDIKWDGEPVHPHIKVIKTSVHWKRAVRYLGKEDPDNADLKMAEATHMEKIQDAKTLTELFSASWMTPQMASGAKLMWENRAQNNDIVRKKITLWDWQQKLADELAGEADDRKVIWIVDEEGGMGKSKFIEWMKLNRREDVLSMTNTGIRDAGNQVYNAHNAGWSGKVLLIDMARTTDNVKQIYEVIEHMKNGSIVNMKWGVTDVMIRNIPHVVVFANWFPIGAYLSKDRWDVRVPNAERNYLLKLPNGSTRPKPNFTPMFNIVQATRDGDSP